VWPSHAILTSDPNITHISGPGKSWKMHIKDPGKSWKTSFSVLCAICGMYWFCFVERHKHFCVFGHVVEVSCWHNQCGF